MIRTVSSNKQMVFEDEVNALIKDGFILSSSCCNTYQYEDYQEQTYWTAILIKE